MIFMKNKKDDTITSVITEVDIMANLTEEQRIRRNNTNHKYARNNCKKMTFEFNKNTDADILEKFEKVPSKLGYIKKLIREDIKKENE